MQECLTHTASIRLHKAGKLALALLMALPLVPLTAAAPVFANSKLELKSEEPITAGAVLKSYDWKTVRDKKEVTVDTKVIQIDLKNPYVKLDVMTGTGGQYTKNQTIQGMANETGAAAGVNGDFYNTKAEGVPIGPQISNGQLMATPPYLPGFYTFAITKDRKPIVDLFTFQGKIIAKDGTSYPLGGINKTYYWFEPSGVHSMIDGLFMYTSAWGQDNRSNDGVTVPTEVLVINDVVTEIKPNSFFRMIAPENGYILRASGKAAEFVTKSLKVGDTITADYTILPTDPTKSYDYKNFQMMIGGHTIMVNEGKPADWSRRVSDLAGFRARTGVGYSKDERYVYLITVGNSGSNNGVTMAEFQTIMIQAGIWKGLNLDGGGSTQMVSRPLGESAVKVVNQLEFGTQRKVVNGLGVYSLAPTGQVQGILMEGPSTILLGQKASYTLKAYDEYYNPVVASELKPTWTVPTQLQSVSDNTYTFFGKLKGKGTLTVQSGKAKATKEVEVAGSESVNQLKVQTFPSVLRVGEEVTIRATVTTRKGEQLEISPDILKWELRGIEGAISGDKLRITSLKEGAFGQLIGRYDGFGSSSILTMGETREFINFEKLTYPLTFSSTEGVTGAALLNSSEFYTDGIYGELQYDFTQGTGTKAAYAVIGNQSAAVPGEPQVMRIKVQGDNSKNWLRAEFVDAKGAVKRLDLAKSIDWSGWKTIEADLAGLQPVYPVKLTRIYVASVDTGAEQRSAAGSIMFDSISFDYRTQVPAASKNTVKLVIDKPTVEINGSVQPIEIAPMIVSGTTLVPLRFVTEELGGEVAWDAAARRATIYRNGQMMEFWLGQKDYSADGLRKSALAAPLVKNDRALVPLRVLSEHLGWKVSWDEKTRTVTLE